MCMLRPLSGLEWLDSKESTVDLGLQVFDELGLSYRRYRGSFVLFITVLLQSFVWLFLTLRVGVVYL